MRTELDRSLSNIDSVITSNENAGKYLYDYMVFGKVAGKSVSIHARINGSTLASQAERLDGAQELTLKVQLMLDVPGAQGFSDTRDESGTAGEDPTFSAVFDEYERQVGDKADLSGSDSMAIIVEPHMEEMTFHADDKSSAREAAEKAVDQVEFFVKAFEMTLDRMGSKVTASAREKRAIYQVKKVVNGREVNASAGVLDSMLMYPITRKIDRVEVKSNYVAVASVEGDNARVMVVYGPDKGATMTIAREMLTKPDILPCFAQDGSRWTRAVEAMGKGLPSLDTENVINNALGSRKSSITAAFNSDDVKDSVLSLKAIQEVCEPYLGPVGMVMALSVMKKRIFKEKA